MQTFELQYLLANFDPFTDELRLRFLRNFKKKFSYLRAKDVGECHESFQKKRSGIYLQRNFICLHLTPWEHLPITISNAGCSSSVSIASKKLIVAISEWDPVLLKRSCFLIFSGGKIENEYARVIKDAAHNLGIGNQVHVLASEFTCLRDSPCGLIIAKLCEIFDRTAPVETPCWHEFEKSLSEDEQLFPSKLFLATLDLLIQGYLAITPKRII